MANISLAATLQACPHPFLVGSDYPYVAGQKDARLCAPSLLNLQLDCCLPCPLSNSIYPSDFDSILLGAQWLAVPSLVCTILLLISFAVLPVQRTSRHYLTICLIVAIFVLELAFVVPLGTRPDQCYDAITPHNMRSDVSCAFSGAFILFGGFGGVTWVFIRSLSVHLQICWKYVPGDLFFYAAQFAGWGLPILFTVLALVLSGVSYRLGSTCHINHENSIGAYWGPLLALSGISLIMQLVTFFYCIKVYLEVAAGPKAMPSSNGTGTQVTTSSARSAIVKRATYRRVRKVIALQWRGMAIVVLVVITACYLATVFLLLDHDINNAYSDIQSLLPWVTCLVTHDGDKEACTSMTSAFVLSERVVLPVSYLIVACGIWSLLFLGQWGMLLGWQELILRLLSPRRGPPSSLKSRSQLSFQDRMQATPQHLHIVKGEAGGLSVARKSETMDIEMVTPVSPAHSDHSRSLYDEDHGDHPFHLKATPYTSNLSQRGPMTAPLPSSSGPLSGNNASHVSFNFSRPSTAQAIHHATPSYPQPTQILPHSRAQSQHSHIYIPRPQAAVPQRKPSNASESWLIHHAGAMSHSPPPLSPGLPLHNPRYSGHRGPEVRANQGPSWDPTSTFASSIYHSRSATPSPHPDQDKSFHALSDSGSGGAHDAF